MLQRKESLQLQIPPNSRTRSISKLEKASLLTSTLNQSPQRQGPSVCTGPPKGGDERKQHSLHAYCMLHARMGTFTSSTSMFPATQAARWDTDASVDS